MRLKSALRGLVERQHGVISRWQLLALGISSPTIQHWRERGLLHTLHAGVYAWGHAAVSWQGRCVAALLAAGDGAAISHAAAAVLHGLMSPRPTIDVTAPRRRDRESALRVHRGALAVDEVTEKDGIRVTTVERTLFDLCDPRLVSEAVARRLTTLDLLADFVDRKRGVPGVRRFARVVGLPQYRSKFERDFHRWLRQRGFPEPAVNAKVGRRRFDFIWREQALIVETDGPHHRTPQQLADDERAAMEAARHGFRLLRVPEEGFDHRQDRVAVEIWTALAADIDRLAIKI
jgi:very-short-patch-repair endonuclease